VIPGTQIEGMPGEIHRRTGYEQASFIGLQLEPTESITIRRVRSH
jgi:hypothetical protein